MFNRNEITDASLIHRPVIGTAGQRFPWTELEEYQPDGGMWSIPGTREVGAHIAATAELMRDIPEFKRAMRRALNE